ncbi:sex-regulated protein janus-A-like [Symsagittifera roscoffensis]|uniref:sex-regulated protein janus-A-like n=1 Tax=Symsagittifera roscoffensis TaxID=84072 RepID=UPI00307B7087
MKLDEIEDVEIDNEGKFKYILIKAKEKSTKLSKLLVRGYAECPYHADILEKTEQSVNSSEISLSCPGGGRIERNNYEKTLFVFGYSQGFGQADHSKTVSILKNKFPDYTIEYSNEGY